MRGKKPVSSRIQVDKIIRSRLARLFLLWLAPFLILQGFFFVSVLGAENYLEIFPSELVFPTALNVSTALIIAAIVFYYRQPRSTGAKLVVATLLGLLAVDYDSRLGGVVALFRSLLPILPKPDTDLPIISILFMVLLFAGSVWVGTLVERIQKTRPQLSNTNIIISVFITISIASVSQWLSVARITPTLIRETRTQAPLLTQSPDKNAPSSKPDIYYIVLDRYTNTNVLRSQFGYTDTFIDFLNERGFTVNETAKSNYPFTTMSISSTLNATYTNKIVAPYKDSDIQSRALYHNLIRQSSVAKALRDAGYKYTAIGSWYGASYKNPLADHDIMWDHTVTLFGQTKRLHGIEYTEFSKSPFFRFAQASISWWPLKTQNRTALDNTKEQLRLLNNIAESEKSGSRFIFAHMLIPHDPFYFNGDGSLSADPSATNNGKPIKDKYSGQIKYISDKMQELILKIQKQSNNTAVILLNSDEGPYPNILNTTALSPTAERLYEDDGINGDNMTKWPNNWLQMKYGILQAAYIPSATKDELSNLSSVNLFRVVLNSTLGYNLPYLPNCHYALNISGSREYNYTDITSQLTGTENPRCKNYQSVPSTK